MGEVERAPTTTNALAALDDETRFLIRTVLFARAPELLGLLESTQDPSPEVRDHVGDVVADEFSEHLAGPDQEPTDCGTRVDDALGRFFHRFPVERG